MKYVHLLRDPSRTKLRQLSLHCRCGFRTPPVLIGFVAEDDAQDCRESWRVAWWDAEKNRLVADTFLVPLKHVSANRGRVWVAGELLPQLQVAHGNCFGLVAYGKWWTEISCPECAKRNLMALSLKS